MPVDEFGREIPAARGGRRSPSPIHHHHHSYDGGLGGGPAAPSLLYEALPSSRYTEERERSSSDRHERRGDRGGNHDDRPVSRKRKHRSESPPPSRRGGDSSSRRGEGSKSVSKSKSKPHPSTVYNEEPMLCQYLWKEANEGKTDEDYEEYRKTYCLNYVRMFFNEHMDDSWFRSMYSPLERYRVALQEKNRASQEAKAFAQELQSSIAKQVSSSGGGGTGSDPSFFVLKARLGNGIRQAGISDYRSSSPQKASQQSMINPIPGTHAMDLTNQVLPIHEIPPHVTDDQLTAALMQNLKVSKEVAAAVALYSGPPAADLTRSAFLFAPEDVRKEIIQQLNHLDRGGPAAPPTDGSHVPRKEDTYIPKTLELVVECSDAYGRTEVDSDGKGGQPEDRGAVPTRKASVLVSTRPITPNVQVLSAALSSKTRINQDQQSAYKLAKAYDARRGIPPECRLETLLQQAVPKIVNLDVGGDDIPLLQDIEDALDVTIAYLRRVHLLSFYNACTVAHRVAEVLEGNHAASTIHLRLANADEILEPKENEAPVVDLLVQRLDDSIQKALDEASGWETGNSGELLDAETDAQAKEIEHQEGNVEESWIQSHSVIDQDGRARCSFHFCRKLFKDSLFLRKHLMKKHSEFLRAEIAKCHDGYMMKAWDSQEQRPVPPILVDCGHRFGLKPSPVLGASKPLAADPEPDLWRREEERREMAEKEAEARRERYENNRRQHHETSAPSLDGPLSEDRGQGGRQREKSNFVDVDDMKEEKVEMAFDSVEIPVQPPKKKKKKKLL
jgi:SERRATE/Ars2, N-terminal domain